MDPCEISEPDKLCSGEFSDKGLTAGEEITETCEDALADDHAKKSAQICQKQGHKYLAQDVFLSHSGAQKNFVRHLHRYLKEEGVSCFFDEDPQSLRKGEKFPPCIFEATETCRVAVLVLSKEFIRSKWPMLELTALVKAKKSGKNPNLKIIPIFFKISPKDFCPMTKDIQDWKELEESEQKRGEWLHASTEIRSFNGFTLSEGENEVSFIDKVVRAIKFELPPSPAYFVSFMQGQKRMCKEVANLFKNASSEVNGIHIAGLYGLAGSGKTTVSMAFCNFNLCDFEGKVCHVEFQRGKSVETAKHVLQHLLRSAETLVNSLTTKHVAWEMFSKQACGQRVLLALDNITEDPEIIEEVRVYLSAEFASGSHILLSARSLKILVKFLPERSCMHVPNLTKEEAIGILLERTSVREWALRAQDRAFALKCAKRCWFREPPADNGMVEGTREFHPLALKSFGGYLFTKHESDLSRWISELSDFPKAGGRDLQDVLAVLEKAYLDMDFKYQTIFILLSVYLQPKMSSDKVFKWLAIICNTNINYIQKAVEDLMQKAFIERVEPEVRIHDLLVEFAQNKVNKMEKWLWVNGNMESLCQLISEDDAGFELIKFEDCTYRTPSMVRRKFLENLLSLQLVDMKNLSKLDLSSMDNVRSIIIHNCKELQEIEGMEKLSNLAWLQICQVKPTVKLPIFSNLYELRHLEIDIPNCAVTGREGKSFKQEGNHSRIHLGDLTCCVFLKEICVRSPFLSEFPTVKGLPFLEKLEFIDCFDVMGPLDCTGCSELQKIVFNFCCEMAHLPLISGCSKLSEIVLWQCDALIECPQIEGQTCLETLELCISSEAGEGNPLIHLDSCFRLKNIQLWNMRKFMKLPEFSGLSRLTTLSLHCCGICDPPEFGGCPLLENVSLFSLKKLKRFPSFSGLRALRKLCLWNCKRVRAPPDISGCSQLQVFHLVYNDNMQGLPQMDDFHTLEEIKISWHAQTQDEFIHMESDSDSEADEFDDLEFCLNRWKDTRIKLCQIKLPVILKEFLWLQRKTMLLKMYLRGGNLYYSITAPYDGTHNEKKENNIGDAHPLRVLDLEQFFTAEIRRIRRVHEMRWGRKWGYDFKLSDAGLHESVFQLFEGLNLEDHLQMEGKELWLQMWKEWEGKWEETSECIWNANKRLWMLERWMEWHIKSYWEENWKKACGVKQTMAMVRERCIEWDIENYWEGKDYLIYEKHWDIENYWEGKDLCKGRLAENGEEGGSKIRKWVGRWFEGLREKLRDEGGSKIRNYWEEKWKEMSETFGGNEGEEMAMERFIEYDIQNYWKKKWKLYQKKELREMFRERLIWEMNSMKKIDALLKRQQRILLTFQ